MDCGASCADSSRAHEGPFQPRGGPATWLDQGPVVGSQLAAHRSRVYAWREIADEPKVLLGAAWRRLPDLLAFCGRTAAWLLGLDVPPCDPIEAIVRPESRIAHLAGISIRRSQIEALEITKRRGFPTTSVVRTLADLGRRLPIVEAVAALDAALHRRLLKVDELTGWLVEHDRFPGIAR